jgi:hypothetical protein
LAEGHEERMGRPVTHDELKNFADIAHAAAIRAHPFTEDELALFKARGEIPGGGVARLSDEKPASETPAPSATAAPAPAPASTPAPAPAGESKPAESPAPVADSGSGTPPASPSTPPPSGNDTLAGGTGSDKVTLGPPPKPEAEGAPPQKLALREGDAGKGLGVGRPSPADFRHLLLRRSGPDR